MSRNLVICLDGTGGQLRANRENTNVILLYDLLDHSDPAKQIAYYDPGVGTFASAGAWTPFARWISRMCGFAFGSGLRQNLGEAYIWLIQNWTPGDKIFIFGFSRGAYTARALVGMLHIIGLLRPGSENLVPYTIATYARPAGKKQSLDKDHKTSKVFARRIIYPDKGIKLSVPVAYMGLWDTVKFVGVFRQVTWPFTNKLKNAVRIRHAMSIHEKRAPFRELPVEPRSDGSLEEVWFAGVHSDVGGTFDDDKSDDDASSAQVGHRRVKTRTPQLSTITLKWIIEGGIAEGLLVRSRAYKNACSVSERHATSSKLHRRGWAWWLAGTHNRKIPAGASVHASVETRALADATFSAPIDVVWVDCEWASQTSVSPSSGETK